MTERAVQPAFGAGISRLGLWVRAMRPRTLTISIAPIVVGAAHAKATFGRVAIVAVTAATISALAIQIATNLANDAADGERGHDGPQRLGPLRVTGAKLMSPREVRNGAVAATLIAVVAGLAAAASGGLPIILIGVASIFAAWAYSHGPCPISATPLGEIFVVAFFGVAAVVGTELLAAGRANWTAGLLGIAIGLPAAGVLTVNNHRDRAEDARNGRRTLAILIGEVGTKALYAGELFGAVTLAALAMTDLSYAALVGLAAFPAFVLARRLAAMPIGSELNGSLAATGAFQLLIATLVALTFLAGEA